MITESIMRLLEAIKDHDGNPLIVGGYVRDCIMGLTPKDIDIEVYNLDIDLLINILSQFGEVNNVGKSFGILKVKIGNDDIDISLPRRESKQGSGHKGFDVSIDSNITPEDASNRRDFTFNALFMNPFTNEVIDLHEGLTDIKNKIIKHTSDYFRDDSLRVLRAMQFSSRMKFTLHPDTITECNKMMLEFDTLAKERITEEFNKMFLKGKSISMGLDVLTQTKWITKFPELNNMVDCNQESEWHPEGDVWEHTKQVCDSGLEIADREQLNNHDKLILLYACLLHDVGKPITTSIQDNRIISHGHESMGIDIAKSFLNSINADNDLINNVLPLIGNHLSHLNQNTKSSIRRLSLKLQPSNIKMLSYLMEADYSGRGNLPKGLPKQAIEMLAITDTLDLETEAIKPILLGRHLITRSYKPSKEFGIILNKAFEAQIEGEFDNMEDASNWLDNYLSK